MHSPTSSLSLIIALICPPNARFSKMPVFHLPDPECPIFKSGPLSGIPKARFSKADIKPPREWEGAERSEGEGPEPGGEGRAERRGGVKRMRTGILYIVTSLAVFQKLIIHYVEFQKRSTAPLPDHHCPKAHLLVFSKGKFFKKTEKKIF